MGGGSQQTGLAAATRHLRGETAAWPLQVLWVIQQQASRLQKDLPSPQLIWCPQVWQTRGDAGAE